jgi:hypothetical protein
MCPAEIKGRLKAYGIAQKRAVEGFDDLAWMIGNYTHASPKKYPKKPAIVKRDIKQGDDTDEEMQAKLTVFAQIQNAVEGAAQKDDT